MPRDMCSKGVWEATTLVSRKQGSKAPFLLPYIGRKRGSIWPYRIASEAGFMVPTSAS